MTKQDCCDLNKRTYQKGAPKWKATTFFCFFISPQTTLLQVKMPKPLIVQFTPIRSCLVNLPGKWVNALLDQKKVNNTRYSNTRKTHAKYG